MATRFQSQIIVSTELPILHSFWRINCSLAGTKDKDILVTDKPALAPSSGIISDFIDPYTLKPVLIVTTGIYLTLTTLGIGARLITTKCANESMLPEDC